MSTKCSLLFGEDFHLYFDYKDWKIHYEEKGKEKKINKEFLDQVNNLCKFRDAHHSVDYFRRQIDKDFKHEPKKNDKLSN